jgi:hypothetical protein
MCAAEVPDAPGRHQAVVTFPGCDLVALIDLNTGVILSSTRMRVDGTLEDAGANPVCSAECPGGGPATDAAPATDGGAGGGSNRIGVTALAIHPETAWPTSAPTARLSSPPWRSRRRSWRPDPTSASPWPRTRGA